MTGDEYSLGRHGVSRICDALADAADQLSLREAQCADVEQSLSVRWARTCVKNALNKLGWGPGINPKFRGTSVFGARVHLDCARAHEVHFAKLGCYTGVAYDAITEYRTRIAEQQHTFEDVGAELKRVCGPGFSVNPETGIVYQHGERTMEPVGVVDPQFMDAVHARLEALEPGRFADPDVEPQLRYVLSWSPEDWESLSEIMAYDKQHGLPSTHTSPGLG